jgi:DNA primase catalytic subunit
MQVYYREIWSEQLYDRHRTLLERWLKAYNELFGLPEGGSKFHDVVHDVDIVKRYKSFRNLNDLNSERIHQLPSNVNHNNRQVEPQLAREVCFVTQGIHC